MPKKATYFHEKNKLNFLKAISRNGALELDETDEKPSKKTYSKG